LGILTDFEELGLEEDLLIQPGLPPLGLLPIAQARYPDRPGELPIVSGTTDLL